ncbi:MAG: hypothetical protein K0B10_10795 [Vicingaceae bacterium]|nr:hypothetical protein [Vicingaceae bacterium]
MKTLLLTTLIIPISFYLNAQETKNLAANYSFYLNAGINIAAHNKEGYQFTLSVGKNKHILQLQFLETKNENFSTDRENESLNAILKVKAYSAMYGYAFQKKNIFNFLPSIGIIGGSEFYRTDEVDFLGNYGCSGWFCFSDEKRNHYEYHYNNTNFIGSKISLTFQAKLKKGYAGLSVEHYFVINNNGRYDFGITLSLSIGKFSSYSE